MSVDAPYHCRGLISVSVCPPCLRGRGYCVCASVRGRPINVTVTLLNRG